MPRVGNCYVVNLVTQQSQPFWYHPESVGWSKSTQYSETEIFMRSEPIPVYSSSGARTLALTMDFFAEQESDDVKAVAKFFDALVHPRVDSVGLIQPPPRCLLVIGDLIQWTCIVQHIDPVFSGPFNPDDMLYHRLTVAITFREVSDLNRTSDVAGNTLHTQKGGIPLNSAVALDLLQSIRDIPDGGVALA